MEIYQQIRKLHQEGVRQRKITPQLGISRNTVKKYMEGEQVSWERKRYQNREATVLTPEVRAFIDAYLENDRTEGTKKQKHTAKRIYDRLKEEQGFTGGETAVRAYVRARREKHTEVYVRWLLIRETPCRSTGGSANLAGGSETDGLSVLCPTVL